MFEDRRLDLVSRGLLPKGTKLPNLNRLVARDLLTGTLRGMGYHLSPPPDMK
jgi:hypothetical protein